MIVVARYRRPSDTSQHTIERPRHLVEVEGLDEQARVADLPPAAATEPAVKLILCGSSLPRGLVLERAESSEVSLGLGDPLHGLGAVGADQLLLQVSDADIEAQLLHVVAREAGAQAYPLESSAEVALLAGVTETRQRDVESLRPELRKESPDGLCAADRHDRDALGVEIAATPLGECFERTLVADSFDEDDCSRLRVAFISASSAKPAA